MSTTQADVAQPKLQQLIDEAIAKVTATDKAATNAGNARRRQTKVYGKSTSETLVEAAAECKVLNAAFSTALEAHSKALKQLNDLELLFPSLATQITAQLLTSLMLNAKVDDNAVANDAVANVE
jgi:hypothetical protein